MSLACTYTATYPEVLPDLTVELLRGLNEEQGAEILALAIASATENLELGPIVFTVAEAVKEWLIDNNREPEDDSMHARMLKRQREKEEAEEEARVLEADTQAKAAAKAQEEGEDGLSDAARLRLLEGTPVTPESFAEWNKGFMAELLATRTPEELAREATLEAMKSGKQLFNENANLFSRETLLERALDGREGGEEGGDGGEGGYGDGDGEEKEGGEGGDGAQAAIQEDLFGGDDDDLDLDDLSSDD